MLGKCWRSNHSCGGAAGRRQAGCHLAPKSQQEPAALRSDTYPSYTELSAITTADSPLCNTWLQESSAVTWASAANSDLISTAKEVRFLAKAQAVVKRLRL